MGALCRDCLSESAAGARRCSACGSPRVISHSERDGLSIAHIDCDAFYAAVEKRDNPALADKPVIIGGGRRGVVSTCCYIARIHGVRSAMPMFKALAACPEAVVIKPDMAKYAAVGRQVRERMLALTPLVEPLSIDEAFLDLSGTERLHGASPAVTLARFARDIERDIGITVSVGLSYAKFLAKIASDLDKPRGFSIIGRAEAVAFLADKPVSILPGIGKAASDKLAAYGFRLLSDVASAPMEKLFPAAGADSARLQRLARGIDERRVNPERETKSVSAETTFDQDISALAVLEPILWRMAEKTAQRLRKAGLAGKGVTLKLKGADFRLVTRSRQLPEPTQLAKRLYDAARDMLAIEANGRPWRLIGVGAHDLTSAELADHGDLADTEAPRIVAVERAVEKLRDRFGAGVVVKGVGMGREGATSDRRSPRPAPDGSGGPSSGTRGNRA
jgi:DNA polymerase-4